MWTAETKGEEGEVEVVPKILRERGVYGECMDQTLFDPLPVGVGGGHKRTLPGRWENGAEVYGSIISSDVPSETYV